MLNWKNLVTTSPSDVKANDAFALKVVAVVDSGGVYWAAYRGPTDCSDGDTAKYGSKIGEDEARLLFYALANSDIPYRS